MACSNPVCKIKNLKGDVLDKRIFKNIELKNGHDIKPLEEFRFKHYEF